MYRPIDQSPPMWEGLFLPDWPGFNHRATEDCVLRLKFCFNCFLIAEAIIAP